jgi:hypothetical protein
VHSTLDPMCNRSRDVRTHFVCFVWSEKSILMQIMSLRNALLRCKRFPSCSKYSETIFGYFAGINATRYEQDLCLDLCYQDKHIAQYGCASLLIRALNSTRYCMTDAQTEYQTDFGSASNPRTYVGRNARASRLTLRSTSPSCSRRATLTRIRTTTFV